MEQRGQRRRDDVPTIGSTWRDGSGRPWSITDTWIDGEGRLMIRAVDFTGREQKCSVDEFVAGAAFAVPADDRAVERAEIAKELSDAEVRW